MLPNFYACLSVLGAHLCQIENDIISKEDITSAETVYTEKELISSTEKSVGRYIILTNESLLILDFEDGDITKTRIFRTDIVQINKKVERHLNAIGFDMGEIVTCIEITLNDECKISLPRPDEVFASYIHDSYNKMVEILIN